MADSKKYYYLRLTENFFDSESMIVLESMADGYLYSNILLKLYAKSLKSNGRLMFNDRIPYNATILAQITRHQVGTMEKALRIFRELGLIEVLDNGAIYMLDIQNFIGKSSTEADRKREYRAQIEVEKETGLLPQNKTEDICPDKSTDKSIPEIETETDLDLDLDLCANALSPDQFFEVIWKKYPRKRGKDAVKPAQRKKLLAIGEEKLTLCIERYLRENTDPAYLQYGSTFFNGGYVDFLDENYSPTIATARSPDDDEIIRRLVNVERI